MAPKGSIVITGSNGGLGSATVDQIVHQAQIAKDYYGIYTVRKVETADAVKKVLSQSVAVKAQHQHELLPLDLSSLASTRRAAESINERVASGALPPIRALILNAGYQEQSTQAFTGDGFDMSFQANFLSHFLLTLLLLQSMDKEHVRIVVIGSWTHDPFDERNKVGPYKHAYNGKWSEFFPDPIDIESIAKGKWSSSLDDPHPDVGYRRYGISKCCEVMMFRELSERLPNDPQLAKVDVLGLDPGGMPSSITRRTSWLMRFLSLYVIPCMMPIIGPLLTRLSPNGFYRTTWKSGGDVVRAAFDTKELGEHPNGLYLNGTDPWEISAEAKDKRKTGTLWREALKYAGIKEGETILSQWQ
ncbi:hypothetical protein SLS62_005426 [Diatrype stigma]|uniref:Uncharacterized protein n=1 Tax=Diatrype stigma TaxID=117547 RepID=A0AAN9YS78_9PEZI